MLSITFLTAILKLDPFVKQNKFDDYIVIYNSIWTIFFLKDQQNDITEFDERMVRKLIWQIIIYQDRAMIKFKSG